MRGDRGRQVDQCVEVLELTGSGDRQQPFDGAFALITPRAQHDLPPHHGGPERALGDVVRRLDTVLVHEGEETRVVHKEGERQVAHVGVGRIEIPFPERKEALLDRQDFGNQVGAGERRASSARVPPIAMPQPKQTAVERQRLAAESLRRRRGREFQGAEKIAGDVGPRRSICVCSFTAAS